MTPAASSREILSEIAGGDIPMERANARCDRRASVTRCSRIFRSTSSKLLEFIRVGVPTASYLSTTRTVDQFSLTPHPPWLHREEKDEDDESFRRTQSTLASPNR